MGKTLGYGEITVANMTEPFTVMLTNEAQQFATDSNRKVTSAQSYYTDIIVIRGSQERTDYTIGNITSGSGITVSKSSKRVTFSVSAGATIGADTGVIEIPITLDGQTVKKQFSWSCGKQGPQGVKGKDGTSVKITSKSVTYQTSTSGTTAPTGTWSTTVPTVANGQYLWTKTTVQYSDDNKTEAYSVSYKGTNGTNGTSVTVSKTEVTYQVSASGTTAPTGTWSTTMPSCDQGQYLWTKTYVKYSDGKDTTSYSVSYKGVDGEKFAFNMLRETNQGSKHWVNMGASGKYSVESITTEDSINAVKLICTKPIASNEWQFCDFSDYEMLKSLKASTTYTLSYDIKTNRSGKILHNIKTGGGQKLFFANDIACKVLGNETWEHVSLKMTSGTTLPNLDGQVIYMFGDALSKVGYSIIKNLKLTEGIVDTPWAPHPKDLEGRGVSQTVQYYLATSQASGVTSSTSGWSTDITTQKLTADKKYLWNCYQTKYSDGTSEPISTPKVIGVYGDKGQNAKNLSITPSSQYFKSTDGGKTFAPNAITIKPTIQGEISFGKWQYSIDGGVSFTDVVSGQKGLTISNNVLTVSKDSSLYSDAVTMVTFRAVASDSSFYDTCSIAKIYDVSDIQIGGRNLVLNSDKEYVMGYGIPNTTWTDGYAYIGLPTTRLTDEILPQNNAFLLHPEAGKTYTQTIWIETDANIIDLNAAKVSWFTGKYGHVPVTAKIIKLADNSYKLTSTYTVTKGDSDIRLFDILHLFSALDISNSGTYLKFGKLKVEQGNVSTDWTPAPEDVQTAILSTKSEISDVSLKVDKNKQAIEQRVEKTTYQQDLNLVKGDISKANEGLNKWRYEIYPKSLFASEYQGKSTMDVFAKNTNLTPSQSVLINDTDLSIAWNYAENYIGYALTFAKFSAAKSVAITFAHDDGAHIYLNGKLIGGNDVYNNKGESLTLGFVKGWNCIEVVVNEGANTEGFKLGTTISALSECQLMNCYYGTPVARQSHITNQLVENTTNIEGVTTTMQKVMTTVGGSDRIDEFVNNYNKTIESEKQFKKTIGETYTTKDEFNGLEIGGRNLILNSAFKKSRKEWTDWGNPTTREIVSSNGKMWAHIVGNKQNYQGFNQWTPAGSIKEGDHITFSARIKGSAANQKFSVGIHWLNSSNIIINQDWHIFTVDTTENIYTWAVDAKGSGCDKLNLMVGVSDTSAAYNVYFTEIMVVKGNKSSDWTPAPEDNEINGQNLVSNLPSNWEQGSFNDGKTNVGCDYDTNKSSMTTRIRVKELVPVSGTITISNSYSNQSKKPIQNMITAFDVNKKWLGSSYVSTAWSDFPRAVDMKDAKYIAVIVRYKDESAITPSDISQICLKIERGTSATPFTLAPEDVNGKIVNVETIANQTAKKFEWIVKGGDKSSSMVLTDDFLNIVANKINLKGKVTFESLSSDAKSEIGKVAQSKVDGLEVGGRNLLVQKNITQGYLSTDGKGSFISSGGGDQTSDWIDVSGNKYITITLYEDFTNTNNSGRYCEYDADKNCINTVGYNPRQKSSIIIELKTTTKYIRVTAIECKTRRYKIETGNKPTDWTPAPEDVSQDATNKASQALTDAKNYSSSAVNWVTNNGSSTISLNAMVKKWTDGAVSDTAQINGGWIKANTITASKIALADFTNYSQLTRDTADAYGFTVTDDTDGTWFSTKNIKRDQFISEIFPCNGGESYLIEYDISTNAKGANNSTDTKNYIGVAIGVYGYTGTVGSNGLPNKATNIWYADRITGSETAPSIHVKTTITTSTATKQFRVFLQSNGYYFEGTTKIRNLSVRRMYGGTLIVDGSITADKIATDAIKSRNYISSGGTQGSFLNLSDGSFTSPNLSWDSNGNLIAKNANLSGEITATNGSIAGWTIISNKMYTTGSGKYTGIGKYGSAYAFWAGATSNDNGNSAVFKVSHTGKLTATDADITGTITATNGKIGRYDITSTYLMTNSGSNASGIGGNQAFWAGAEDSNSAPFRVGYDGVLWAENAAIRGSIETGNLGDEGDTVSIINGHIGIQGTSNNVEIYSTGFKFGIDGDYYLMSVSEGVKCYRNLYATDFVADGWLYCSEVHSSGAVVIGADSESFYWAHGYQIARGTSWGGVCVGDDSQQLRLYGSSIWASHSISTSDENLKENFTTLDQYENFYMNLNPIGFNYIGDYDGKKTHFGFGAHKTEDVLESEGYDADKFAVVTHRPLVQEDIEKRFGKDVEVDIETEYGVSYTEFIALNTHMIQKTRRELTKVKQEKADLEVRLQAIEAKLGL
ncbi:MAG: tail fiber domain-containing protein [Anaerostipes hadrus]